MFNLLNVSKKWEYERVYVVRFVNRPISGIREIPFPCKDRLKKCYCNILNDNNTTLAGSSIAQFLAAASLFGHHRNQDLEQRLQIL